MHSTSGSAGFREVRLGIVLRPGLRFAVLYLCLIPIIAPEMSSQRL